MDCQLLRPPSKVLARESSFEEDHEAPSIAQLDRAIGRSHYSTNQSECCGHPLVIDRDRSRDNFFDGLPAQKVNDGIEMAAYLEADLMG